MWPAGQTDKWTDEKRNMTKLVVPFRNLANTGTTFTLHNNLIKIFK